MKNILKEFKEFAVKGNVIDLAVGVVIGGAFGKIVSSLVSDIISPLLSVLTNSIDLKNLHAVIKTGPLGQPPVLLNYGLFIENIIDFIIISFTIFLMVKGINQVRKKQAAEEAKPVLPPRQEQLLEEIRDLLKSQTRK